MPTIPEALAIAIEHHRMGRLRTAEAIYFQILASDPNHPDAWHLLGLIASPVGDLQNGAECIQRALMLSPDWAEAHFNLGNSWKRQGKLDLAIACYRRALQLKPDFAEGHNNRAKKLNANELPIRVLTSNHGTHRTHGKMPIGHPKREIDVYR